MTGLPPVEQVFLVNATAFLAGIDEMLGAVDRLAESLDAAAATAERLGAVFDGTSAADERLAEVTEAVNDQTKLLTGQLDTLTGILDEAAVAAQRTAGNLDIMAASADKAGESVTVAGDDAEASGGKAATAGAAWKTAFLGVALALGYGIEQAAKYQSSSTSLLTQAGVAKSQFAGLQSGVLSLAGQIGFSPNSLMQSLYHVESSFQSLGIKGPQALNLVKIAAEGAQTGHADLVDVTNALDATIAAGLPGIKDYSQAMGALNAIVGTGDMTMQDLANAMGTGLMAQAKMYGQSIYEVGAALATFGDNNIRGAKAATDLRMTWQAMQAPLATSKPLLASIGLQYDSLATTMEHHGLSAALDQFISSLKSSKVPVSDWGQYVTEIFGKRAGTGIGVLIDQEDRLKSKFPDLKKAAGDFGNAWATQQKTMSQQWDDLKSGAQSLAISFGTVLLPAATKVVGMIAKFAEFLEKHGEIAAFAGALLALAAGFKIAATAEKLFGEESMLTDPIFLILAAIIALAAGLYELYRHCKTVRDVVADVGRFFKSVWTDAMHVAGAVVHWFVTGPLAFIKGEIKVFSDWWKANGAEVKEVASAVWHFVSTVVTTEWKILWDGLLKPGLAALASVWKTAWGVISDTVKVVWDTIAAIIRTYIKLTLDVISVALDLLTGHWSKAWTDIKKLVSDGIHGVEDILGTFIKGALTLLFDAGKNIVTGLINGIKSMFGAVGSVVSDLGKSVLGPFKSVLSIFSPSQVFHELGVQIVAGLTAGIIQTASQASSATAKLAEAVKDAFEAGDITGSQSTSLTSWLASDNARLQSLATQRATIAATIKTADTYAATTTSNTESWAGLSNVASSMTSNGGTVYSGNLLAGMQANLASIKAFSTALTKLGKLGLRKDLLDQIIQMGPDQGLQVAQALIDGPLSVIKSMDTTQAQIVSGSTALGQSAADAMYDSGSAAGKGFLSGLEAQQSSITKMMDQIAQSMITTVKRSLKISSPSMVMAEHGLMTVLGFAQGMEAGTPYVRSAAKGLAVAAVPGAGTSPASSAAAAAGAPIVINVNVTVNGFVGSNTELAQEIYQVVQTQSLRHAKRNGLSNGLSL